jgi:hypothetical protein
MKQSAKFLTFVMALSTSAMVPPASGQGKHSLPTRGRHQRRLPPSNSRKPNKNRRNSKNNRTTTVGLRVRQPVPQSERLRGTRQGARPSEPWSAVRNNARNVASRGGQAGKAE